MNLIETSGLSRTFGRTEAVHDLDLTVASGRVTALVGANGAGKTTTLRLLLNLLRPTCGSATILGVDSRRLGPVQLARLGFVSDDLDLPQWMTVRQFLDFSRPFYPTWDRDLEAQLLRDLDLPSSRRLKDLSRGMRMKAVLLSALAHRPELLVLDEPFAALDPLIREELARGIMEVTGHGDWTVLIASHDIEEVERFSDRVVMLDGGRKRLDETTEGLQGRFRRLEVTITEAAVAPDGMGTPPAGTELWLEPEQAGRLRRWVVPDYVAGQTEALAAAAYPGAAVAVSPMTLREIMVVLAREGRTRARLEGAAQ